LKDTLKAVAVLVLVTAVLAAYPVAKLWAYDWEFKCLFAQCRKDIP
jgi:hypothetical protein